MDGHGATLSTLTKVLTHLPYTSLHSYSVRLNAESSLCADKSTTICPCTFSPVTPKTTTRSANTVMLIFLYANWPSDKCLTHLWFRWHIPQNHLLLLFLCLSYDDDDDDDGDDALLPLKWNTYFELQSFAEAQAIFSTLKQSPSRADGLNQSITDWLTAGRFTVSRTCLKIDVFSPSSSPFVSICLVSKFSSTIPAWAAPSQWTSPLGSSPQLVDFCNFLQMHTEAERSSKFASILTVHTMTSEFMMFLFSFVSLLNYQPHALTWLWQFSLWRLCSWNRGCLFTVQPGKLCGWKQDSCTLENDVEIKSQSIPTLRAASNWIAHCRYTHFPLR